MKQKSKQPHPRVYRQIPMLQADPAEGLSPQEIKLRQSNGLSNIMPPSNTKSEGQIIKENVLTFFNLIFLVLALCLCLVGSFKNLMFLLVAAANTVVGSFQEIRAKRAVDKLTLVAAGTAKAIRSGQRVSVRTDQLVRDDIVEFAAGDQICADAVVRDGQLQVNESLLTGEADAILKNPGDTLKSGSFVISGRARVQLTHVGSESYAAKLAAEARRNVRSTKSEMMLSLTKLITVVGIALIPLGIILFLRHFLSVFQGLPLRDSVESTVSALIGMIPEGLYLLTSVAIAASCLKLSRKRVLVQDMNCIETLAHVDVLCVDKTGTITEPTMEVTDVYPLNSERFSYDDIEKILAAFYHGEEPDNETARAMGQQFAGETTWPSRPPQSGRAPISVKMAAMWSARRNSSWATAMIPSEVRRSRGPSAAAVCCCSRPMTRRSTTARCRALMSRPLHLSSCQTCCAPTRRRRSAILPVRACLSVLSRAITRSRSRRSQPVPASRMPIVMSMQ